MKSISQQLLSYVSGTIVEKRPSAVSGELEVWYQNGKYVLHSPDANYSFDTLHKIFQKAFKKLEVDKRNLETVLILGFGAGSIATILCDELKLAPQLTGIELDPEVIALGKKYFDLDRYNNLTLHMADAADFVAVCKTRFDMVVSDVFVDKHIPSRMLKTEYVMHLVRLTTHGGLGMMNIITETKEQHCQLELFLRALTATGVRHKTHRVSSVNSIISWIG
ncbi:MAG: fused MFS/spermidine synthase [Cyclobacteriaceae bacterium]|nr:fused MFS/spermidine synthase [Cyclobacteriaceae bacterium]UYN86863.1 MAG: fused MFS/spermidine synthase [Cyclobacteriaceae bacterium]